MAFAGNPKLICDDPEFVEAPEDGTRTFKAGELVYVQAVAPIQTPIYASPGYIAAVAAPGGNPVVVLGQVQTDSTGVAGTLHKIQVIDLETDIEIVTSAAVTAANLFGVYESAVASNVHTLNLSASTDPTFIVKRCLRVEPDGVHGAYDTRAVVRLRPQVSQIMPAVAV